MEDKLILSETFSETGHRGAYINLNRFSDYETKFLAYSIYKCFTNNFDYDYLNYSRVDSNYYSDYRFVNNYPTNISNVYISTKNFDISLTFPNLVENPNYSPYIDSVDRVIFEFYINNYDGFTIPSVEEVVKMYRNLSTQHINFNEIIKTRNYRYIAEIPTSVTDSTTTRVRFMNKYEFHRYSVDHQSKYVTGIVNIENDSDIPDDFDVKVYPNINPSISLVHKSFYDNYDFPIIMSKYGDYYLKYNSIELMKLMIRIVENSEIENISKIIINTDNGFDISDREVSTSPNTRLIDIEISKNELINKLRNELVNHYKFNEISYSTTNQKDYPHFRFDISQLDSFHRLISEMF